MSILLVAELQIGNRNTMLNLIQHGVTIAAFCVLVNFCPTTLKRHVWEPMTPTITLLACSAHPPHHGNGAAKLSTCLSTMPPPPLYVEERDVQ
jgi:hypothetical protein